MSISSKKMKVERSDPGVLDLLRKVDSLTVSQLATAMEVTDTAARQRLNRLMGQGLITRTIAHNRRGRPSHHYQLTEKGRRNTGENFADLAITLWEEIRAIPDASVRRGLLGRLARTLSDRYASSIRGTTTTERMQDIERLFNEKNISFSVEQSDALPVLTAHACPYPDLAEQDRAICSLEKTLFSNLLNQDVKLTACRLDGASCCTFEMS